MSRGLPAWVIGLLPLLAAFALACALAAVVRGRRTRPTLEAVTFFDESVQGLSQGAPVEMRGVRLGAVTAIDFAPDRKHIAVTCRLDLATLSRLRLLDPAATWGEGEFVPPTVRALLASSGLTGVLVVQYDFFDPGEYPAPELRFQPPWNYVPAIPSLMRSVTTDLTPKLADLPAQVVRGEALLDELSALLERADPVAAAGRARAEMAGWDQRLDRFDPVAAAADLRQRLRELRQLLADVRQQATDLRGYATRERLEELSGRARGLEEQLQGVGESLRLLRELVAGLGQVAGDLNLELEGRRSALRGVAGSARDLDAMLRPLARDPSRVFFEGQPAPEPSPGR